MLKKFQSTLPARGATAFARLTILYTRYFNPRSPHGERLALRSASPLPARISIHAPRTGSDCSCRCCFARAYLFQSTLPARGATTRTPRWRTVLWTFQSTLPARGATPALCLHLPTANFNPRSPHGERPDLPLLFPRRGKFQSTLPARGATIVRVGDAISNTISIHAPRTGSDPGRAAVHVGIHHFNPRSPHGERQRIKPLHRVGVEISIHAPRTGSDPFHEPQCGMVSLFQSTLPARGATVLRVLVFLAEYISIHAPRTGSDDSNWGL